MDDFIERLAAYASGQSSTVSRSDVAAVLAMVAGRDGALQVRDCMAEFEARRRQALREMIGG